MFSLSRELESIRQLKEVDSETETIPQTVFLQKLIKKNQIILQLMKKLRRKLEKVWERILVDPPIKVIEKM